MYSRSFSDCVVVVRTCGVVTFGVEGVEGVEGFDSGHWTL